MTTRRWWAYSLLTLVALVVVTPAHAHHSFAVFDHGRTLTLRGTVTKFQWTNPHAFIEMEVRQADGTVKHYSIELTSINMMQRVGWRSNLIKTGDQIKAVVAPLLNGDPVGLGLEVTLADGSVRDLPVPAAGSFKRTPEAQ